jgi:hypothetical protein
MLTEKLISGSSANSPNHSFQRTPDGAAEFKRYTPDLATLGLRKWAR